MARGSASARTPRKTNKNSYAPIETKALEPRISTTKRARIPLLGQLADIREVRYSRCCWSMPARVCSARHASRHRRKPAKHPPLRAGGEQDGPGRLRSSRIRPDRHGIRRLHRRARLQQVQAIPISARFGDNVSALSARTAWYSEPHLFDHLESIDVEEIPRKTSIRQSRFSQALGIPGKILWPAKRNLIFQIRNLGRRIELA